MNKSTYMTVENPMEAVFKYLSISIVFMFVGFLFGKLFVPASLVYAANIFVGVLIVGLLLFGYFFGIVGMVVATPAIAAIKVIFTFFDEKYHITRGFEEEE